MTKPALFSINRYLDTKPTSESELAVPLTISPTPQTPFRPRKADPEEKANMQASQTRAGDARFLCASPSIFYLRRGNYPTY